MTITVDKNVALPSPRQGRHILYPFDDMAVGDSFFVAGLDSTRLLTASRHQRLAGKKFTARKVTENGVSGARIWRTK